MGEAHSERLQKKTEKESNGKLNNQSGVVIGLKKSHIYGGEGREQSAKSGIMDPQSQHYAKTKGREGLKAWA